MKYELGSNEDFEIKTKGGGTLKAPSVPVDATLATAEDMAAALALKAAAADLPYALVTPGEWTFSGSGTQAGHVYSLDFSDEGEGVGCDLMDGSVSLSYTQFPDESTIGNVIDFGVVGTPGIDIVATRASLPGHLCDRAVNAVAVSSTTTFQLPAANPGHMRDLYVRLSVSATSAVRWTFYAQGETWDAMLAPPSSFAAGTYLYRFTEVAAGVWHCEDMLALVGLELALAAINGGVAS